MTLNEKAASWWAERFQAKDEAERETFRLALFSVLNVEDWTILDVDYDPIGPMLVAVRAVRPDCSGCLYSAEGILPMKTAMLKQDNTLFAKIGYGQPYEKVYEEP